MAASIALSTSHIDVTSDTAPKASNSLASRLKAGLLSRAKQVGDNLRNSTPEDRLFFALSMGAGFTAKASVVAALGVATGGTTILAAVAGGAALSLAKAGVKHFRDRRNGTNSKFFSRETLMSTVSSATISAATLGFSSAFEHFTGHTLGETLGKAFHKAADSITGKFSLAIDAHAQTLDNVPRPMAIVPVVDIAEDNVPKPLSVVPATVDNIPEPIIPMAEPAEQSAPVKADLLNDHKAAFGQNPRIDNATREAALAHVRTLHSLPEAAPAVVPVVSDVAHPDLNAAKEAVHAQALEEQLRNDYATRFGDTAPQSMTSDEMAESLYPENPKAYMAAASDMAQDNLESGRSQFSADYQAINETPAPTPQIAPLAPQGTSSANTGIPASTASPQELAAQAIAKAKLAVTQEDLTNAYTMEHLRESVKHLTGVDAPLNATAEDLAKQISPAHSDAIIKNLQAQSPQLKVENLAASCTTEIPKERSAVNVIKTLCYKFKEHMSGDSIAIVDDSNETDPKNGLRLLYRKAVSAMSGLVKVESTNNFIISNISGSNGVVQEMAEAKLGL